MDDFSSFDTKELSEAGVEMTVQKPDGSGLMTGPDGAAVTIRLAGRDSKRYRKAERAMIQRRLAVSNPDKEISDDEVEAEACRMLADLTLGWSNVRFGGEDVPFSADKANEFYLKFPWLRDQADRFISDRARFLKRASDA